MNVPHPTQPIAQLTITLGTHLQSWTDQATALRLSAVTQPLSAAQRSRLRDLNSSIDTYSSLLEDVGDLPDEPYIVNSL